MVLAQAETFASFLLAQEDDWVGHHGDCIGADYQFDTIARLMPRFRYMHIHPMIGGAKRAFCRPGVDDIMHSEKPPLVRNGDIVLGGTYLVATPKEPNMQLRSGTWTTVRYGLKANKPVKVIIPAGAMIEWL